MKTVRLTITQTMTDEFYNREAIELKNEILSGKFQREIKDSDGIIKVIAKFEEITTK